MNEDRFEVAIGDEFHAIKDTGRRIVVGGACQDVTTAHPRTPSNREIAA